MPDQTPKFLNYLLNGFPDDYKSSRGIPRARFIEDIEAELSSKKITLEELMEQLQQNLSKYQMMEQSLGQQRLHLKNKLPEIQRTVEAVKYLKDQYEKDHHELNTYFKLNDNLYMNANVKNENRVALILGANVMVEYTYDEALELLAKSQTNCENTLEDLEENLAFLRDQRITTEVCASRGHNYGVEKRQESREKEMKKQKKEQQQVQNALSSNDLAEA